MELLLPSLLDDHSSRASTSVHRAIILAESKEVRSDFRRLFRADGIACVEAPPCRKGCELVSALPAAAVVIEAARVPQSNLAELSRVVQEVAAHSAVIAAVPQGDVEFGVTCARTYGKCLVLECPLVAAKAIDDVRCAVSRGRSVVWGATAGFPGTGALPRGIRPQVIIDAVHQSWNLTPTQTVAAYGVLVGRSDKEHADAIGCSQRRVGLHLRALRRKGGGSKRCDLPLLMIAELGRIRGAEGMMEAGLLRP